MYYLFVAGNILALIFPRNICYCIAKFLSVLHFYTSKKDRETVAYNLSLIFNDKKEIERYTRETFINFAYYLVDFFRYSKLNHDFIKKYVKISGLEHLDRSIAKSKGVIILTAHLGNYELAGAVTSLLGYLFSVIALPHKDTRTNNFFNKQRHMTGMKVVSTGGTIKACFSLLKRGETLALLGDRDFSGSGIKLKMFSGYAYFPRGAAFFALRTGAFVIPAFLVRENKNFYHLSFERPIICEKNSIQEETAIIQQYISVLEKYIKKYPGQWYMFERYWLK